jgi:hypothetical protein
LVYDDGLTLWIQAAGLLTFTVDGLSLATETIYSERQQTSSLNPQSQTIVVDQGQLKCLHQ